jgi:peptide/nickel transport system permease protein
MGKSYVTFMISRGFRPEEVLGKHAYKPPLASLISAAITRFAGVFGGSTVLEFAFAIPGLSTMLVSAMDSRDYTILQTYILVVIIWMFFVHLFLRLALQLLCVRRAS